MPVAASELVVEGLEKSFGDLVVLRGLSLEVTPGRILGFLGRNGAGKTTTMRCIFGLLDQDAGSIRYGGQQLTRPIRRQFGYMPEERGLYPKMSIITQLVHFGRLAGMGRREARDAAMSWLDQLGLADRSKDRLDTLSHGNQQRVQLAAALVHGPQVLVLDEPFSGLDPVGVGEMGAVLREAAARGATILFSSHQLELVEDLCVDVAIINGGVTVAHGDLATIRSQAEVRRVEVTVAGAPWVPDVTGAVLVGGERPARDGPGHGDGRGAARGSRVGRPDHVVPLRGALARGPVPRGGAGGAGASRRPRPTWSWPPEGVAHV